MTEVKQWTYGHLSFGSDKQIREFVDTWKEFDYQEEMFRDTASMKDITLKHKDGFVVSIYLGAVPLTYRNVFSGNIKFEYNGGDREIIRIIDEFWGDFKQTKEIRGMLRFVRGRLEQLIPPEEVDQAIDQLVKKQHRRRNPRLG